MFPCQQFIKNLCISYIQLSLHCGVWPFYTKNGIQKDGVFQGKGVGDEGCGVDLPLLNQRENLNAVAAVHTAVFIGAVIYLAMLAEKTFSAESTFTVTQSPGFTVVTCDLTYSTHYLMTYGDSRHCMGHRTMLDMQVTGSDAIQRHPDDGIFQLQQLGLHFF